MVFVLVVLTVIGDVVAVQCEPTFFPVLTREEAALASSLLEQISFHRNQLGILHKYM